MKVSELVTKLQAMDPDLEVEGVIETTPHGSITIAPEKFSQADHDAAWEEHGRRERIAAEA